jgi:ABC-2 type transport system ATP-binding protein
LAGLQAPTKGNAYIHGISSQEPASKRALGFLPERPYFYTYLTAKELLRFYGGLCSLSGVSLEKRILELLERTNIMEFSDVPLGKYSKGMLQRVGLCQTLLHDPDVILLDEPMSGLDPVGRALVKEIIVEEKQKGKTVFFCSHVLSDVESICDRVAVVIKGKLRLLGTIRELVQEQEEMFRCVYRASVQCFPTEQVDTQGVRTTIISKNDLSSALLHLHQKNTEILGVSLVQKSLESVLVDEVRRDMPTPLTTKTWECWHDLDLGTEYLSGSGTRSRVTFYCIVRCGNSVRCVVVKRRHFGGSRQNCAFRCPRGN